MKERNLTTELSAALDTLSKAVLSQPIDKTADAKISLRPLLLRGERRYQLERFRGGKAFHQNLDREALLRLFEQELDGRYRQALIVTEAASAQYSLRSSGSYKRTGGGAALPRPGGAGHNREKRYLLPEGEPVPALVDLLLGLLRFQEGQILLDGEPADPNSPAWRRLFAYIPQKIFMLNASIRENVGFGLQPDEIDEDKVWQALEAAQMAEFVRSLPAGLETAVGEAGIRLSGGQVQRLGIARALYADPQILVFDEATSALDYETEEALMESIDHLRGKKTLVIIAHRLSTVENCDLLYRVQDGKVLRER